MDQFTSSVSFQQLLQAPNDEFPYHNFYTYNLFIVSNSKKFNNLMYQSIWHNHYLKYVILYFKYINVIYEALPLMSSSSS